MEKSLFNPLHPLLYALHAVKVCANIFSEVAFFWTGKLYRHVTSSYFERRKLLHELETAPTYEAWCHAARQLDTLSENDVWKQNDASDLYDHELLKNRLEQFERARAMADINASAFLLQTSLVRNFGQMDNPRLYTHSHTGTKQLIAKYNDEVTRHLGIIAAQQKEGNLHHRNKLGFLKALQHQYGKTALMLSGGSTLGMFHLGVVHALVRHRLLPKIISGSSSGAIIAALVCTRSLDDVERIVEKPRVLNVHAFETPPPPRTRTDSVFRKAARCLRRFYNTGSIFDPNQLKACMQANFGDATFYDAYRRTRLVLNVTVSSSTLYEMPRLLNYLTTPNVLIWSAVAASCAVPPFFRSVSLMAKDDAGCTVPWTPSGIENFWMDGSVENDLPMARIAQMFGTNYFIVSQVNPHVIPFMHGLQDTGALSTLRKTLYFLVTSELMLRLPQLSGMRVFPKCCHYLMSLLDQEYAGNITVLPARPWDIRHLLTTPDAAFITGAIASGERATWPLLARIRNNFVIEHALERLIHQLSGRAGGRKVGGGGDDDDDEGGHEDATDLSGILSRKGSFYNAILDYSSLTASELGDFAKTT